MTTGDNPHKVVHWGAGEVTFAGDTYTTIAGSTYQVSPVGIGGFLDAGERYIIFWEQGGNEEIFQTKLESDYTHDSSRKVIIAEATVASGADFTAEEKVQIDYKEVAGVEQKLNASSFNDTLMLKARGGSALLPSYSFGSDPNTGMYSSTADQIHFSAGGTERLEVSSSGITVTDNVLFGTAVTSGNVETTSYGTFKYALDGGGASTPTLGFLSGQTNATPAAATAESAFWSMLSESDGSGGSRLLFEPIVDYSGTNNLAYIGYHNILAGINSYYFNGGFGSYSFPAHTFLSDNDTGMYRAATNQLGFSAGGTAIFSIYSGGMIPIGTNTKESGLITQRWKKIWTVDIDSTNALNVSSDRNLKDDIQPTNLGLDFINDLNPVSYKWKDETVDTSTHYGIIAQDVIETLKNYGVDSLDDFGGITHDKEEDTYGARPTEFVSILIKAIQELSDEVKELKEKN
jgi:hypothetical protein